MKQSFKFMLTIERKLPETFNTVFMALSKQGITLMIETYFKEWIIYVEVGRYLDAVTELEKLDI